jgi:hypothetical protein
VRAESPSIPSAGNGSTGENAPSQSPSTGLPIPEDEVKVQWNDSDQIVVYQFVNRQGSLILQAPSGQMLNLASQIAQELAQKATSKAPLGVAGGKDNGS